MPANKLKHSNFDEQPGSALIRQRQILEQLVPFSSQTLWRRVKDGTFPQPIKIGRMTVWRVSEVRAWLKSPWFCAQGTAAAHLIDEDDTLAANGQAGDA